VRLTPCTYTAYPKALVHRMKQHSMTALALLALACGLATAAARMAPVQATPFGRALQQQQPSCSRISNCEQCYNAKNDDSVTVLVCRVCATGYRPATDGSACGEQSCRF
jgi:hypothetical protein